VPVDLTVSYIQVPPGHGGDPTFCKGPRTTGTIASAIPVLPYSGAAYNLQRAYRSVEAVSGLTVDQIRQFDKRVVTDRVLAAKVSREFKATHVKAAKR
jgi:hypothetical protein